MRTIKGCHESAHLEGGGGLFARGVEINCARCIRLRLGGQVAVGRFGNTHQETETLQLRLRVCNARRHRGCRYFALRSALPTPRRERVSVVSAHTSGVCRANTRAGGRAGAVYKSRHRRDRGRTVCDERAVERCVFRHRPANTVACCVFPPPGCRGPTPPVTKEQLEGTAASTVRAAECRVRECVGEGACGGW